KIYIYNNKSRLEKFAYTKYTSNIVEVVDSRVKEIMINKETGYHFIKVRKIKVAFEHMALHLMKYPELRRDSKRDTPNIDFTGRHVISILLHEIGHNVFIPFYFNQKNDDVYEVRLGKGKPIIIHPSSKLETFNFKFVTRSEERRV